MDRFANCQNAQLPRFNSRYWEPLFDGVDALAQANWHTENYSVNPPFCLLPRVLETIQEQKAHATVIAPKMARTAMVQQTSKPFSRSTAQTSEQPKGVSGNGGDSGTVSKPKVDPVCLESLWRQMLTDPAWSIESAKRFQYCIAPSTLRSYNSGLQKLQIFCLLRNADFPPRETSVCRFYMTLPVRHCGRIQSCARRWLPSAIFTGCTICQICRATMKLRCFSRL